ncbi:MAG: flagellar biosynthetic protein FliR [Sedimentisphaerales bacterium]|nr:flagellar biosynthetic protein FliR [Sedimentisphaerales bacterium]
MDPTTARLFDFVMVLTRVSAFFLILPVFGFKAIPIRIKVASAVFISFFFTMAAPHVSPSNAPEKVSMAEVILLLSNEAIYGLCMGLIAQSIFATVKYCGRITEHQMGLSMAEILDPLTGEQSQPLGMLIEMIFIIAFLSANGHHLFLMTISRSYEAFPAGSIPTLPIMISGVVKSGSTLLLAGLRLAAPMLAAFLLLMVVLAVVARIAPETNILFISLPLRVGLGLMMVGIFMPFITGFVGEFADWMGKLLPL